MRLDAAILALVFIGVLGWMYVRNRNAVRRERSKIFERCDVLFTDAEITQDDINFPVLKGKYGDWHIKLEPIVDHIAVRKIPSIWLLVTVMTPIPFTGSLDFLVRPQNIEFYSPSSLLKTDLNIPEGWPKHAVLRTDDQHNIPPQHLLDPHIALFEEPKMKELLVTARGVRLVYQLDQAARSHYMVLRQLLFENFIIAPELAKHLLESAISIAKDLQKDAVLATQETTGNQ